MSTICKYRIGNRQNKLKLNKGGGDLKGLPTNQYVEIRNGGYYVAGTGWTSMS